MDTEWLVFLSALFGVFCIGREAAVIIRERQIRISNLFLIMYGLTYGIILSLVLVFDRTGVYRIENYSLRFDYSDKGLNASAWWLFAAVIGYVCFRFAGMLRIGKHENRRSVYCTQSAPDALLLDRLQITSAVCLMIGLACFVIWISGWGGYANLFQNAWAIRNGSYGIRNPVAFFAKPAQIVSTVSVISVYLLKKKKNTLLNAAIFAVSFGVSLMYYLAKDGRMIMAMYLLIVLFMASDMFEKKDDIGKKLLRLLILFAVFVVIVLNMDGLTSNLRGEMQNSSKEKSTLELIMHELSFIYMAGQTSIKHCMAEGSPLLIGHDIGAALFAWVPSALTPKGFIDIWDYNTFLIAGRYPTAQYPSDLISTSLYDLGNLGPILLPAFWGAVISKLERYKMKRNSPIVTVLYYSLSMTFLREVDYSMLSAMVASVFHLFVAAVVYWGVCHVRVRR